VNRFRGEPPGTRFIENTEFGGGKPESHPRIIHAFTDTVNRSPLLLMQCKLPNAAPAQMRLP
jgi:hypothetical protein